MRKMYWQRNLISEFVPVLQQRVKGSSLLRHRENFLLQESMVVFCCTAPLPCVLPFQRMSEKVGNVYSGILDYVTIVGF